ncbi:alpha-N-acetylgalactosaminide alpha-2,6-sialyltransferase 2-like [Ptychodera flava]|uniref:alpha-N-acetylgalactosaminide alpha-2,6-sialyltransferase 2-like n=1 Tax=Ptychodera flava TaxID=63121 RepID=UPI00396A2A9D
MERFASAKSVLKLSCILTVAFIVGATLYLRQNDFKISSSKYAVDTTARASYEKPTERKLEEIRHADGQGEHGKTPPATSKQASNNTAPVVAVVDAEKHTNATKESKISDKEKSTNETKPTGKSKGNATESNKPKPAELPPLPKEAEFKTFKHDDSYKKYMQCPTTLRNRLSKSKVFKDRYIPDVPVLMWNESVNEDEYVRLKKFWGCYGWESMSYGGVKDALKHLDTPAHRYMFDAGFHLKNKAANNTGCIRCAVVGGGGILNGSRKGKEIDEHDYVFRVNVAATSGYEVDVGSRTTHYAFTMTTLRNSLVGGRKFHFKSAPHDKGITYLVLSCEKADYILVDNRGDGKSQNDFKTRDPKHRGLPNFGKDVTAKDFKMMHPDFQRYMEFFWINSPRRFKRINRPSTGALMLIAAIHTCDEVNAYGFGVNYRKYSTHYYDKSYTKFVYYANHDFNQELKLWNNLHNEGIINLYKRDDD